MPLKKMKATCITLNGTEIGDMKSIGATRKSEARGMKPRHYIRDIMERGTSEAH